MAEVSFPVVNKPLSEDQWKTIALGFAQGVIDRGGFPYRITATDNVTNEIEIGVATGTGKNESILGGFVHRIDTAKRLSLPAVTATTTYEIGLVYDPLNHGTEAGPITLTVWTAPGDTSSGKLRLVLYQVVRQANQNLTDAVVTEWRQRVSPQISVSVLGQRPVPSSQLVDTMCFVRSTSEWYRAAVDNAGVVSWLKVSSNVETRDVNATASTIPLRDPAGRLFSTGPTTAVNSVINRGFFDNETAALRSATASIIGGEIVKRWSTGHVSGPDPDKPEFYTTKRYVDAKTWDAHRLNQAGNSVWWEIITGSKSAYTDTDSTSTWATVGVTSGGKFFRYTSALKYKENIRPYEPSIEDALAIEPVMYDSKATGLKDYIGVVADYYAQTFPNLVQYGEDGQIEGWHYQLWPVVQQVVLRHHDREIKRLKARVVELRRDLDEIRDYVGMNSKES